MFSFCPLQGAQTTTGASQSLLELDGGVKILVDVGWDENLDPRQIADVEKHAPTLSFILLTHATVSHLGAYVHCCKNISIFTQIPVYATPPVIAFGRTLLQDLYSSSALAATFIPISASSDDDTTSSANDHSRSTILRQSPTSEEITKYFSLITPLKYSQPHQPTPSNFSAPLEGLTLTAYNSGHTLGGTIWHISHGMESIVYAVDWNQARENVIAGADWFGGVGGSEVIEQLRKPTALVCSSKGGDRVSLSGGLKARDESLLAHIRSSLAKGGTVLIPTDSSARVLELAWLLERTWQEGSTDQLLKTSRVYMASKSGNATLRHARSLLEWMDDSIAREFDGEDDNGAKSHRRSGSKQTNGQSDRPARPFEFRHVKIIERENQLERALKGEGARVILASDLSLDWGFSKTALQAVAQKAENLVILTERSVATNSDETSSPLSASQRLWQWYEERQDGVALEKGADGSQYEQVHAGGRALRLRIVQKGPLDFSETQAYQQYMATQRQLQTSLVSGNEAPTGEAENALDDDSSSSSSDESDDEQQGRVLNVSAALSHGAKSKVAISDEDLGVTILLRKKGVYDFDVRHKKGRNAVFPYTHTRKRGDEFGDYIRPEEYLRAEERDEDAQEKGMGSNLGQKRKWEDSKVGKNGGMSKRQQAERGVQASQRAIQKSHVAESDSSESDESESEAEAESQAPEGPTKAIFSEISINVNARLAFVDFAGIHDQRSLQMLIPLIGPKKLILTGGTKEETEILASHCEALLNIEDHDTDTENASEILVPKRHQTVDASVDTNAWVVRLSRELVKRLQWQKVRAMDVVTLTGQLKGESTKTEDSTTETKPKKQKFVKEEMPTSLSSDKPLADVDPVLDVMPVAMAASTRSIEQPLHVGDLRLADLRRLMSAAGHGAEFRGEGTLLIDGMIAVRKLATGKIIVEGVPVSAVAAMTGSRQLDSFTQVKRKIYEGLAVVAAG